MTRRTQQPSPQQPTRTQAFTLALDGYLQLVGELAYNKAMDPHYVSPSQQEKIAAARRLVQSFSPDSARLEEATQKRIEAADPGNPVFRNGRNLLAMKTREALVDWYKKELSV